MAKERLVTRVYNKTSAALPVGFLGDNGVTIAASSYYDQPGELVTQLNPKERSALDAMLTANQVDILTIEGAETDGIWSPIVVLRKDFTTGDASAAIYASAAVPAKLRIIDGYVILRSGPCTAGVDPAGNDTEISIRSGANTVLMAMSIGGTAAAAATTLGNNNRDRAILRFKEIDDAYYTIATGGSLSIWVKNTGVTGGPKGTVYITAIRVE